MSGEAIVIYEGADRCPACLGWGRIANDEERTPWKYWAELPPPSNLAVQLGLVYPVECSKCGGSGRTRPTIVCLCGSTRFYEAFQRANYEETMAGRIVLSVGFYRPALAELETGPRYEYHGENIGCTPEQKEALDELHLRKIDLADEVLILNVGGYIGQSTARELAYAKSAGKLIRFLEAPHGQ